MTAITHEKFVAIETIGGVAIRTAATLKGLITELAENSGEDIGIWIEGEGASDRGCLACGERAMLAMRGFGRNPASI